MKYPQKVNNIIDITKAPYFADNTGKMDCTKVIIQALDDYKGELIKALKKTYKKLKTISDNFKRDVFIGREFGRCENGEPFLTGPEIIPTARILYFPNGTYLISDTICYSKEIKSRQALNYYAEHANNIHFMGEDKDKTIIKLQDNLPTYNTGKRKSVVCFNRAVLDCNCENESTNVAFMNTIKDLTIDCGKGNKDAVGLLYVSSNTGRIENIDVKGDGKVGILLDVGSEGCVRNVKISGFEYGFDSHWTSPLIMENVDVSLNKKAGFLAYKSSFVFHNVNSGKIPTVQSHGVPPRIVSYDKNTTIIGDLDEFHVHYRENCPSLPPIYISYKEKDCAFIEDFGAKGDGKTDCTLAIQKAMESGKSTIIFGAGPYLIERKIFVPKTVKAIDFVYGSLYSGMFLSTGEFDCCFEINEDSDQPIVFANLCCHEQFYGRSHLIGHKAKRDVVMADLTTTFIPLYYNTVKGSKIYIDNCFSTTGTYSQKVVLPRNGMENVFCDMIPFDFYGQEVIARNLNIERADVEARCRDSKFIALGYKVEGPGIGIKAENSEIELDIVNAFLYYNSLEQKFFDLKNSKLIVLDQYFGYFNEEKKYCVFYNDGKNDLTVYDIACVVDPNGLYLINKGIEIK